jgi:cell division protease FtsH
VLAKILLSATNRPATLDLALTRPGRFDKVIYLDLPAKRKRFELFKFYSQVGEDRINWDYFAKQTAGLSAAHISAAMNSSLL